MEIKELMESLKNTNINDVNELILKFNDGSCTIMKNECWIPKPGGDAFRSSWGGETSVTATFDNCKVTRTKGKENSYQLDDTIFKAFGQDVPEEIAKAINISDTNLQGQLDAPYLLSMSSGEVAAHFNRMANLTVIDTSLAFINKDMNALKSEIDFAEKEIEKKRKEVEEFIDLDTMQKELDTATLLQNSINILEEQVTAVKTAINSLKSLKLNQSYYQGVLSAEESIEKALSMYDILHKEKEYINNLTLSTQEYQKVARQIPSLQQLTKGESSIEKALELKNTYEEVYKEHNSLRLLIHRLKWIDKESQSKSVLIQTEESVEKALSMYSSYEDELAYIGKLGSIISEIQEVLVSIKETERDITRQEKLYQAALPEICPICGTQIKHK